MHQYLIILTIATILLLISIYNEQKTLLAKNIGKLLLYRYIHLFFWIYLSFFALLFKPNDKINVTIYLSLALIIMLHWEVFGCCLLSLVELNNYSLLKSADNYKQSYHPSLYTIFYKYTDIIVLLLGLIMSIGIYYVLFNAKFIELKYKILLGLVFTSLFMKTLLSRDNANYDKNILKMFERV
tara:strand:+ start:489 stop:1037 length:549 start_codon:yes stop_codon:yes gene_type:complete